MAAGRGASRTCGYNGCRNPIKSDAIRCYRHENEGVDAPEDIDAIRARIEARRQASDFPSYVSKSHGYSIHYVSPEQFHVEAVSDYTPMDKETAESVLSAVSRLDNVERLEVPQVAFDSIESGFPQFMRSLEESGIRKDRIDVLRLYGLERNGLTGVSRTDEEAYHEVVVLDRGTERETVVDPYVAIFAPVRQFQSSVNDQLPSGFTPFGDIPWVGPVGDYIDGPFMRWSQTNYQSEQRA